jgi:hypothetical protein
MKAFDPAKHLDEDFLGGVGRVRGIIEHPINQAVYRLTVLCDQPGKSLLRSGLQLSHNRGFFGADSNRTRQVTQGRRSRHATHGAILIITIRRPVNNLGSKFALARMTRLRRWLPGVKVRIRPARAVRSDPIK